MKKNLILFTLATIILFFGSVVTRSQIDARSSPLVIKSSCEMNSAGLSNLMQNIARNKDIIVISHLGYNEKKNFGQRRLNNTEIFFTRGSMEISMNRKLDSFLVAEGKKVESQGLLDFYVAGKLELQIIFDKNQDMLVSPCAFTPEEKPCSTQYEKLLYPCKSKN